MASYSANLHKPGGLREDPKGSPRTINHERSCSDQLQLHFQIKINYRKRYNMSVHHHLSIDMLPIYGKPYFLQYTLMADHFPLYPSFKLVV